MSDNYMMIDGKRVDLSDETVKNFKKQIEDSVNPVDMFDNSIYVCDHDNAPKGESKRIIISRPIFKRMKSIFEINSLPAFMFTESGRHIKSLCRGSFTMKKDELYTYSNLVTLNKI